jgi:hypothetical protein
MAGGAAAGVDDAAARVATLEAEGELAVGVEIEDDAARAQLLNGRRGLLDQNLDGARPAQAAAGGEGVGGVPGRGVTGLERRRQATLGPVAGALGERLAGDEAYPRPLLGGLQGGPQAGRAATDDGDVELQIRCYRCPASRRIAST